MPNSLEQLQARLLATFRVEVEEHLRTIFAELDGLRREPASNRQKGRLEVLFRTVHTLKGASRSVGVTPVEMLCQTLETSLKNCMQRGVALQDEGLRLIETAADSIMYLSDGGQPSAALQAIMPALERLGQPQKSSRQPAEAATPTSAPAPPDSSARVAPAAPKTPAPAAPQQQPVEPAEPASAAVAERTPNTIRIDVERLGTLTSLAEELLIPKLVGRERLREAKRLSSLVMQTRDRGIGGADGQSLKETLEEIDRGLRRMVDQLANDQRTVGALVDNLVDEIRLLRMMPARLICEALPRMVRDLARTTAKETSFTIQGADLNVDRKVLEAIKDPLIHLLRNSVDHGLETPDDRVAAGKPREGGITLTIRSLDDRKIEFVVADDGRGLDATRIRDAAVRARIVDAAAAREMTDDAAHNLIFASGLSTSPVITTISGQGVGLAIVREAVERLDGQIAVESSPGAGTRFRIVVPASVATFRGIVVTAGGGAYLWPAESMEQVVRLDAAAAEQALQRRLLTWNDRTLPIARLHDILGLEARPASAEASANVVAVIARYREKAAAFVIDDTVAEEEVLVKELQWPLKRVQNVAAAGLRGNGDLILVLRPTDLIASVGKTSRRFVPNAPSDSRRIFQLLVVDDSATTRMMERSLFEAAGYRVQTASDGLDAWDKLQSEQIDIVVSDVDMPRMNGFELVEKIRAESRTSTLPIVLVTALESREDKERGIKSGANAYVLKSTFDQSNLLEIVRRLV